MHVLYSSGDTAAVYGSSEKPVQHEEGGSPPLPSTAQRPLPDANHTTRIGEN